MTSRKPHNPPLARTILVLSVLLFLCATLCQRAHAQVTYTYNPLTPSGTGTGPTPDSWLAGTNWDVAPTSGTATTLVFLPAGGVFTNATPLLDVSANDLVVQPFQLNILTLGGVGSATAASNSSITIQGGTLNFTDNGASTPVLNLNATNNVSTVTYTVNSAILLGDNLTIAGSGNATFILGGAITGNFGLIKNSTGSLTLSGVNLYTGATTINSGTIKISGSNGLGDGTQATNVININGGVLESTAGTYDLGVNRAITLVGNGTIQSDAGTLTISGNINNSSGSLLTIAGAGNTVISGLIGGGANGITKNGGGTLTLANAANTYQGLTTITAGAVLINGAGSLGTQGVAGVVLNGGVLGYISGTNSFSNNFALGAAGSGFTTNLATDNLTLSGNLTGDNLTVAGSGTTFLTGTLTGDGAADIAFNVTATGSTSVSGAIVNTGGFGLIKAGPGTLTLLSGANSYTGTTTLSGGTLSLGNIAALPASTSLTFKGGAIQYSASNQVDYSAFIVSSTSAIQIGANGQTITYASPLAASNTGGLSLQSSTPGGILILTAANLYSGTTTITSGTLQLGNGTSGSDGTISNSLNIVNNSALIYDRFGLASYSGSISGTGILVVEGSGTQVLTGSNSYTGSTSILIGATLQLGDGTVGHDGTIGGSLVLANNGTLIYDRFGSTVYGGVISGTGNVYMIGTGTQVFSGANTYSGSTIIGIGSTLQLGTGTAGGDGTIAGSLSIRDDGVLSYVRSGSNSYGGTISGAGSVAKSGTGTQSLTGPNTYSGSTVITGGALLVSGTGSLGTLGTTGLVLNGGLFGFTTGANTLGDNFTLGAPGSGFTAVNAADVLTLSGNINGANLNTAGAGTVALTGTFTGNGAGDIIVTVASGTTNISGTVVNAGGFGLQKFGNGVLALTSTNNSYSGTTTLNAGTLLISGSNSLGSLGYAGLVFNSGTLGFFSGSNNLGRNFTFSNTTSGFIAVNSTDYFGLTGTLSGSLVNFTGSGTTNVAGSFINTGAGPLTISVTGAGVATVSGTINDNGGLGVTKIGGGLLAITGSQNYTGTTTVAQGTLAFGPGGALNPLDALVLGSGATSGTLQLGYAGGPGNVTVGSLSGTAAADSIVGGNATTGTLTFANVGTGTFAGVIGGGGANQNNVAIVIKSPGGTLQLTAANTFTGGLTIESGTVLANANNVLGATGAGTAGIIIGDANTPASGATLRLTNGANYANNITTTTASGTNPLIIEIDAANGNTLSGSFNLSNNLTVNIFGATTVSGPITLNSGGSITLAPTNNNVTLSSVISGPGNVIINGSSTGNSDVVTFNGAAGANSGWTGSLIVNSGTLLVPGSQNAFNNAVTIVVNAGGQFGGPAGTGNSSNVYGGFQDGANGGGTVFLNRTSVIAGNGTYTFGGNIITNNNQTFTKEGAGTQTFSGSVNLVNIAGTGGYTTNINSGTLILSNTNNPATSGTTGAASFSAGNINISTGNGFSTGVLVGNSNTTITGSNATLQIVGNYLIGNTGPTTLTIKGGNGTTTGQGTLSLADGQINTLQLKTTAAAGATIFTMGSTTAGAPSILNMEVGGSSDQIIVGVGGTDKVSINNNSTAGVLVNITGLGGLNGTTQTLILSANTGVFTIGSGLNFLLNTTSGNFGGYTLALSSTTAGVLQLTETPGTAASSGSNFYWTGTQGNAWNSFTGGNNNFSNWSLDPSGVPDAQATPGTGNDVYFSASNAATYNTILGQNQSIKGLIFTTTGGAVTIGGTNTLTIGADGITVQAGAGAPTISSKVATNGNQTWTLNDPVASPLNVSGNLTATNNITTSGSGGLVLGGSNSISGTFSVGDSTLVKVNSANALNFTGNGAFRFAPSSTGTLALNGFNATINSLSGTGAPGAVIQNGSSAVSMLTINQLSNGTFAGVMRDGSTGALGVTLASTSTATLNITGANTYTGSTIINGGNLNVRGSLGSSIVNVNSGGLLSGTGGTIGGPVTVNSGGRLVPGSAATPGGTLTLSNGLTIGSGGVLGFDFLTNGSAHDQVNITSGGLTLNSGAIIEVTSGVFISGTYALASYTGANPDLVGGGILFEDLSGGALSGNYSFIASGGTLSLVIAPSPLAIPQLFLAGPAAGTRVMANTNVATSGTVTNSGTSNALSGTLSSAVGVTLNTSGFSPNPVNVSSSGTVTFSGSIATGTALGTQSYGVTVTDGNASPTTQTGSNTLDVVGNRVITGGTVNLGYVHVGTAVSGTVTLSSTGADSQYTRITISSTSNPGVDANNVGITGGSQGLVFNGTNTTDTRVISTGSISNSGTIGGSFTLYTSSAETGGPLAGESDQNVSLVYTATVFSGHATWASGGNSSWSTGTNWVNDGGVNGAPGLSGSASLGDMATFIDLPGEASSTVVNLNGVNPSLAGLTFSATNTIYTIAPGTSGTLLLQNTSSINLNSGTAIIATAITGTNGNHLGTLTFTGSAGSDLQLTGNISGLAGNVNIVSGTLTLVNQTTWATGNTNANPQVASVWNISSGAVLEWSNSGTLINNPNNHFSAIEGSGTFLISSPSGTTSQIFVQNNLAYLGMSAGGVMEIGNGAVYVDSNGLNTGGINLGSGPIPANQGILKIDAGGAYSVWDNNVGGSFDALIGSGTVTRLGYQNGQGILTIGVAGGSGTFDGVITNAIGTTGLTKQGGGTETLTGSNSYAGQTTITGGILRITNSYGLGFGAQTFVSIGNQHTTTVSGGGALDLSGNLDVNEVLQLTGNGNLTNSAVGTTAILDSGLAGVTFTNNPNVSGSDTLVISGGSGSGASGFVTRETAYAGEPIGGVNSQYLQLVTAGSGYTTGAGAPTITSTFNLGTITAQVSSLAISGANNNIGGAGNLLIRAQITGSNAVASIIGSGTVTLTANELYTGTMNVSNGVLVNNGSMPGVVNVTGGVFSGTGIAGGAVTLTSGHLAPGVNGGGNVGGVGTLTLNGGLTIGNGTQLDYDLGSSSDLLAVTGQLTLGTGISLNINPGLGFSEGVTYTLITYSGSLTGDTTGWTVIAGAPTASTATFASGGGVVTVSFAPTNPPATAYFSGAQGSGGNATWSTFGSGTTTNWVTAITGGSDTNQVPYLNTNVFFMANSGSNLNTYLGGNFIINSLNFTGTNGVVTTGSAVTITGSIPASGVNNTLTINATGTNGNTPGSGITMAAGSGPVTINAPLVLGGNQVWTLNADPGAPLTINGRISGNQSLAVSGSGQLVLAGNNTFNGGFTINNSANVVLSNTGALNGSTPDALTFGASSTGTLNLNGNNITIGTLSSNGGLPVIRNGNVGPATLTVNQAANSTFVGSIRDGAGSGALSFTKGGGGTLTLSGSSSYTGATTINGGELYVTGMLTGAGAVAVNSGTLGGSGGSIAGAVNVASGATISPTVGTGNAPGTLTLGNGLTIQGGGIAAFDVINGGANDQIVITSGGLVLNDNSILQVSPFLTTSGTYALITYTGADPDLTNVIKQDIGGGALQSNYSIISTSGTIQLVVTATPLAIATVTINSPAPGSRVIAGTVLNISGSVGNPGTSNSLSGSLSDGGGSLQAGNFVPNPANVTSSNSVGYTGTAGSGASLGFQTIAVTVTDGSSLNGSATATGTVDVLGNRQVAVSGVPNLGGAVHVGTAITGTITLSSTGADTQYTRVKVGSGTNAFGISASGGNTSGTYNGSFSDTRVISGTYTTTGSDAGITLTTTSAENGGAGLSGESDQNVIVGLNVSVFSGHASWGLIGNGSWSANSNWGDTLAPNIGGIGAPGLAGALSVGDVALFTDVAGQSGTVNISLNGVSPSLAALTFSSTGAVYNITTGGTAGGVLNIQGGGSINVTTGTGQISATIGGTAPLNFNVAPGTSDLIVSSTAITHTGSMNFNSGTTTFTLPGLLANGGANVYTIAAGATLELNTGTAQNINVNGGSLTITGSGTLLKSGTATLDWHGQNGNINMNLLPGSLIEISGGLFQSGGLGGNGAVGNPTNGGGSIVWTNNKASLLIDVGGSIDPWDGNNITVDALLGSGTVTRNGYGTGNNVINIGIAGGSGTFAGTITNNLGNMSVNKVGAGLEVFTGSNSFGGYVAIQGGTLRVTNSTGLGFGGYSFKTFTGQHTSTASGTSVLDIAGGITINETLTLNNGSLINSVAGTTSIFDSGIAGINFDTDNATAPGGTTPITVTFTGGSGTGASAIAGTVAGNTAPLAGGNAQNLYTQMTNAGSGYLPGSAPTVSIVQTGSIGGNVTAVVSQLILAGNNNFIGGAGNLRINGLISGAGGFTTIGTGTVTLTQLETYTGITGIGGGSTLQLGTGIAGQDGAVASSSLLTDNGQLIYNRVGSYTYNGSISGTGSVTILGSGTQTFGGANTYTGATVLGAGSTLQLGTGTTDGSIVSSTLTNNGTIIFNTLGNRNLPAVITGTGGIAMIGTGNQEISGSNTYSGATTISSGTLQLGSTTALGNTSGITISGSGALNLSNGSTPQTITLSSGGQTLTLGDGSVLGFGVSNAAADQLVISGGAVLTLNGTTFIDPSLLSGTGGSFTIITDLAGFQGSGSFALGPLPALATGTLTQTGTTVTLSFTGVSTAYWNGNGDTSGFGFGLWSDYTNFTSDPDGTTRISGTFGPQQDVVFSSTGAINQTAGVNFLDQSVDAHSLTINDPAGVDIGFFSSSNILNLAGTTGITGINVGSAAGSATAQIDAYVNLGGKPNITVNNTGGLVITGVISGSNGLIVNGSGMLTLTGQGGGAAFNTYSGGTQLLSGTLSVYGDGAFGASGSGNGVTFDPGAGNSATLQINYGTPSFATTLTTAADRAFVFNSGTSVLDPGPSGNVMTISGTITGTGALQIVNTGEVILGGTALNYNGTAYVTSGTLGLSYAGTLGQTGSSAFNTAPGATLIVGLQPAQNLIPSANNSVAFTGSGTLIGGYGGSVLEIHGHVGAAGTGTYAANGEIYMDMSGGTIEVATGGLVQNGGPGALITTTGNSTVGTGSPQWTGTYNGTPFTNLASLQIDASGTFDVWNGNNVMIDALNGSGLLTRLGYLNNEVGSTVTIGDNGGSGTFSGVITNLYGVMNIIKTGGGTQEFAGDNSYSGSTLINGGVLRVTSNTGLGNGGRVYYTGTNTANAANSTVAVTGSAGLDLDGGVTINKVVVLNGGSLTNDSADTTSTLDNGIAAITIGGAQVGTYSQPTLSASSAGNGSGASFTAGTGTAPGGATLYGQVLTPGSGYTTAPVLAFTDSSGTGSGVTATAVISSLTLNGNSSLNFIGGNGNLTINARISGTSGFTTTGTGVLTLTGSNTYTGPTTVANGNLANNGYITGVVNVNPNAGGPATISGTGVFLGAVTTGSASGSNVAHIAPGVNTSGNFGTVGTLTFSNGLTIGDGTNLDFDMDASDLLAVTGQLTLGNSVVLNVNPLPGFSQGTYTLMTYTGALTGNTSNWTVSGLPNDNVVLTSGSGVVQLTVTPITNDSQLSISPSPVNLGSVLVGYAPVSVSGSITDTDSLNNGSSALFTTVATGSATIVPASGTVAANASTGITVGMSGTVTIPSGNNQVIGTVAATNNSNAGGSTGPVDVVADVYEVFSGSTSLVSSGSSAVLNLTNFQNDDGANGQRAGVTITGFNTNGDTNFVITYDNGSVDTANQGTGDVTSDIATFAPSATLLNGTYNYSGSVTGTAQYTDPALAAQASVANQVWTGVSLSVTVTGQTSGAASNIYSAQIKSGSSYAGYSLSSSAQLNFAQSHPNTGPSGTQTTTATLLAGTASGTATVNMSFDSAPTEGPDDDFRSSDILTLTGINQVGTRADGVVLTDEFVLQLTYDTSATGLEYIAQNSGNGWINAIYYNSNNLNNQPSREGSYNPLNETYDQYLAANPGLTFAQQLGAYGYSNGVAWAVLDHTSVNDPISEFAVIPEPGTYAMIFSGFGMLIGFRTLRRRSQRKKA